MMRPRPDMGCCDTEQQAWIIYNAKTTLYCCTTFHVRWPGINCTQREKHYFLWNELMNNEMLAELLL
jgi:hypothetical protein